MVYSNHNIRRLVKEFILRIYCILSVFGVFGDDIGAYTGLLHFIFGGVDSSLSLSDDGVVVGGGNLSRGFFHRVYESLHFGAVAVVGLLGEFFFRDNLLGGVLSIDEVGYLGVESCDQGRVFVDGLVVAEYLLVFTVDIHNHILLEVVEVVGIGEGCAAVAVESVDRVDVVGAEDIIPSFPYFHPSAVGGSHEVAVLVVNLVLDVVGLIAEILIFL